MGRVAYSNTPVAFFFQNIKTIIKIEQKRFIAKNNG